MKEEWKPDELRANAEDIRAAIMPKSVTPEMVGGTLLGLVNAVGEVVEVLGEIPREHVKVKVRGYDINGGEILMSGASVFIDRWCVGGFPSASIPRIEVEVNAEGKVEFDVPFGYKYAVFSKMEGLGASFQWVFEASQDERDIELWNQPIGIYAQWMIGFMNDDSDDYPYLPALTMYGNDEPYYERDTVISAAPEGFVPDEVYFLGVLVSTKETSFIIPENDNESSMSDERKTWAGTRYMRGLVPFLPQVGVNEDSFNAAAKKAASDMDGNINTSKIIDFYKNAPAADWAVESGNNWWQAQRWLPSAGQLYLIYLNRAAIDKILKEYGINEHLVSTSNKYFWSSTQYDEYCSWVVNYDGYIDLNYSDDHHDVRAVSAFHFDL